MAKSSKRRQTSNGSAKKQLKRLLTAANAHSNPLDSLPPAFLRVEIASPLDNEKNNTKVTSASVRYYKSPLPPILLKQCLDLFERNMGDMYRESEWGLDMEEKKKELEHEDARFLIILEAENEMVKSNERSAADDVVVTITDDDELSNAVDNITIATNSPSSTKQPKQPKILGFAHFRFEPNSDSPTPHAPITYLYELQISLTSHGLGKKLMTLIELLSLKLQMTKVILTVFKRNKGAMRFYLERLGYEVDECSPSMFEGEENEGAEYEILSKALSSK